MHDILTPLSRIPVTILSGATDGKMPGLLERMSREPHRCRIVLIEQAPGEHHEQLADLLPRPDQHSSGDTPHCVCCTVRGDPLSLLEQLAGYRRSGDLSFDRVVIRTRDRADTSGLVRALNGTGESLSSYRLHAVISSPDTSQAVPNSHQKPADQAGDLAGTHMQALLSRLQTGGAKSSSRAQVAPTRVDPDRIEQAVDAKTPSGGLEGIDTFVFRSQYGFRFDRLGKFMASVLQVYGNDLLRYKGTLHFSGCSHRVLMWGSRIMMGSEAGAPWGEGEVRESSLIFVGRNLPREVLSQGLEQCLDNTEPVWRL